MNAMHGIAQFEKVMIYIVLGTAFVALVYAYWLARQTFAADKGSKAMQTIWGYIRDGANAYLRTQLRTVVVMIGILAVAMFMSVVLVKPTGEANELFCQVQVEEAFASEISANTDLSAAEIMPLLKEETSKQVALANGYADFRPERVASQVECQPAVWAIAFGRVPLFTVFQPDRQCQGGCGCQDQLQESPDDCIPFRNNHRDADRRPRPFGWHDDIHHLW